ncbi:MULTISPECIES: hypothetical protein [Halorussus]|uniref:hypothetical protein n=1 Tax=Halorussus TaxID=1070314 RepID=UPI00209F1284|nr:hypothetical protein [Halorussus vallis]USZ76475.1 hypothetical protein NGM07_03900 [Halorussus vallis]
MGEVREDVLEEVESHSETLTLEDFVRLIEENHYEAEPGVDRGLLADYAEAAFFDVDLAQLDDRTTDSESWVAGEPLYEVGENRVSAYPLTWHEAFGGTDDLRTIIEMIQDEVTEPEGTQYEAVTEQGIPEDKILRVAQVVAGIDRQTTRNALKRLRDNGEIEEYASQARSPTIRLS